MSTSTSERARRPFWIHQVAEYVIGLVLVSLGLQAPDPLVPAVAGGAIILNAALVHGPLGAFDLVSRRQHRLLDLLVILGVIIAAIQPWASVDNATRAVMIGVAAVLTTVWWYTDFAERLARRERRERAAVRGEDIGRGAGRLAASAMTAWRNRRPDGS